MNQPSHFPDQKDTSTAALVHVPRQRPQWLEDPIDYALTAFIDVGYIVGADDTPDHIKQRFNAREQKSAEAIVHGCAWTAGDRYSMASITFAADSIPEKNIHPRHIGYMLGIPPKTVMNHSNANHIIVAHEFKHASIDYTHYAGHRNIRTIRNTLEGACKTLAKKGKALDTKIEILREKERTSDTLLDLVANSASLAVHHVAKTLNLGLRMGIIGIERRFSRFEEYACDNFAVRAFPEANIDDYETYIKDCNLRNFHRYLADPEKPTTNEQSQELLPETATSRLVDYYHENFCSTHPPDDKRLAAMRKQQAKILKNG